MSTAPIRLKSIPLSPRWPKFRLEEKMALDGGRSFRRGFQLQALSDQDKTFPSYNKCRRGGILAAEIAKRGWPTFTGVDLASDKRPGNFIATVALDPLSRLRYVVDARHGAWKSNETADHIETVNTLFRPHVIMVESNAYQTSLMDWAIAAKYTYWMKLEATVTGQNKNDLTIGLPSLQVEFEHESWIFPSDEWAGHEQGHQCSWCILDNEMTYHPLAATSDGAMALWFARQGIETYGYASRSSNIGDLGAR